MDAAQTFSGRELTFFEALVADGVDFLVVGLAAAAASPPALSRDPTGALPDEADGRAPREPHSGRYVRSQAERGQARRRCLSGAVPVQTDAGRHARADIGDESSRRAPP